MRTEDEEGANGKKKNTHGDGKGASGEVSMEHSDDSSVSDQIKSLTNKRCRDI